MSPRLRLAIAAFLVLGVVAAGTLLYGGSARPPGASDPPGGGGLTVPTVPPTPTPPPPDGGTELYGYVPYWEMHDEMAPYLDTVPVSTLALFSVTARPNGSLNTRPTGYQRITGDIGRRLIADAHRRNARVELVFSSFGADRNARFFGRRPAAPANPPTSTPSLAPSLAPSPAPSVTPAEPPWRRTVDELVALAVDLRIDGINVDIERLDELDRLAYGEFLALLRAALVKAIPEARLSVATEAGFTGVANAATASAVGVDRIFLMGYDYHWSGSQPGASSPIDRLDGLYTLRWSIDRYVEAGVPRDRILLGLPLYGRTWKTIGPSRGFHVEREGQTWLPRQHLDWLLAPSIAPSRDELEMSEYLVEQDGDGWAITYYDSPATLRAKLALALDNGLAGGGFWAIGYERGAPGYLDLMHDFRKGRIDRSEAPPRPPG